MPVSYEPVFSVNKSTLRNGTGTICKDNTQCIFDYQVTGDEKMAKSTLTFNEKFKQIQEDIEKGMHIVLLFIYLLCREGNEE